MSTGMLTHATAVVLVGYIAAQLSLFNERTIVTKETFSVTCDVKRFKNMYIPAYIGTFNYMYIYRVNHGGDTDTLVMYKPYLRSNTRWTNPHIRQNTDVVFSGGHDGTYQPNRETIQIVLTFRDACCSDVGEYMCSVGIIGAKGTSDYNRFFNQTEVAFCEEPVVQGEVINSKSNKVGETAVYTCTFVGGYNLTSTWRTSKPNFKSETKYPVKKHITNNSPESGYNCEGCKVAFYISRLMFTVAGSDHGTTYICVVLQGNDEKSRRSLTLSVDTMTDEGTEGTNSNLISLLTTCSCVILLNSMQ